MRFGVTGKRLRLEGREAGLRGGRIGVWKKDGRWGREGGWGEVKTGTGKMKQKTTRRREEEIEEKKKEGEL